MPDDKGSQTVNAHNFVWLSESYRNAVFAGLTYKRSRVTQSRCTREQSLQAGHVQSYINSRYVQGCPETGKVALWRNGQIKNVCIFLASAFSFDNLLARFHFQHLSISSWCTWFLLTAAWRASRPGPEHSCLPQFAIHMARADRRCQVWLQWPRERRGIAKQRHCRKLLVDGESGRCLINVTN